MSKVIADISMSLDGYVTARGADLEHGLGIGGEAIHAWVLEKPRSPVDEAVLTRSFEETGAVVMGRRPYDIVSRFRFIALIAPRPLLMIVGREAVTSHMTTEAFWNAQQPKELFWVDGATHVALYDKEEYVTPAIAKLTEFFRAHLTRTTWDRTRMTVA